MILLHRLAAHHFKQLRDIELKLPDSGSVLIEGHNEAGKSSLFEAVFFALFGKPLLGERDYAISDLKRYGADAMEVALDFSIAGRAFNITRRYGKNHTAKLTLPGESGDETISSLSEIRKRLGEELSLSSDALLNTCFVEQKRLERLEDMKLDARRDAINELLNLKILTDLEARFKTNREARDELERQQKRVAVAKLDALLPQIEGKITRAEKCLLAAQRREARAVIELLTEQIESAQQKQTEIQMQRQRVVRQLEAVSQISTRLQFLNGELSLRLAAWQNAQSTLHETRERLEEALQRAQLLPQRVEKLATQQNLAREYIELQSDKQSLAAIQNFLQRRAELENRARIAREQKRLAVAKLPATQVSAAVLVSGGLAVLAVVVAWLLRAPAAGIGVALVPIIVGVVLWNRHRAVLAELQRQIQQAQQEVAVVEGEERVLETHRPAPLQGKTAAQITAWLEEYSTREREHDELQKQLRANALPVEIQALQSQLAVEESELERERQVVSTVEVLDAEARYKQFEVQRAQEAFEQALAHFTQQDTVIDSTTAARRSLERERDELQEKASHGDAKHLTSQSEALQTEYSALDRKIATWQHEMEAHQKTLAASPVMQSDECDDEGQKSSQQWEAELSAARDALVHHRADRRAEAQSLELADIALDLETETSKLNELQEEIAIKRRAGEIVLKTRADIVSRVMPLTIANVRRVLPLLTEGRYRDVQWDEESNSLAVYDSLAQEFVRKRVFSGGARDQISLALRLAFALATLPGEHNIRPGFLFLDEPLSSFDRARTQALVELLTRGLIRQSFQQIFLVSHSQSFDPALFDFRLRMEGGRVVESTLP
jgi:energy-coupling factor transporter ATP-binding protein EcfA2